MANPEDPSTRSVVPPARPVESVPVGHGRWRLARRAVIEAWGEGGWGVRAVLTSGEFEDFLADLLAEAERAGASYHDIIDSPSIQRHGR